MRCLAQYHTVLTKCLSWGVNPGVFAFLLSAYSWQKDNKTGEGKSSVGWDRPKSPPNVYELLVGALGVRRCGIWVRLSAASSSQSSYCHTCLCAHIGQGKTRLRSSDGQERLLGLEDAEC